MRMVIRRLFVYPRCPHECVQFGMRAAACKISGNFPFVLLPASCSLVPPGTRGNPGKISLGIHCNRTTISLAKDLNPMQLRVTQDAGQLAAKGMRLSLGKRGWLGP